MGRRSGSSRRLPSGEDAPLRASQPRGAASPRGVHGSGPSAGARGARAGGGAAARAQGRCLSPTSELSSGRPRSLACALALLSRSTPAPAARRSARGPVGAHPRPEPARRPRAPGSRPPPPPAGAGRHVLFEPNFAARQLPGRPAGGSPSPARPVCGARRDSGDGDGDAPRPTPAFARAAPQPAPGLEEPRPGRRQGAGRAGPHLRSGARPAPRALTPEALPRRSDRLRAERSASRLDAALLAPLGVTRSLQDTFAEGQLLVPALPRLSLPWALGPPGLAGPRVGTEAAGREPVCRLHRPAVTECLPVTPAPPRLFSGNGNFLFTFVPTGLLSFHTVRTQMVNKGGNKCAFPTCWPCDLLFSNTFY